MLITPRNLHYILGLSVSSRLLVILVQFISNIVVPDHNADAYRNRYHRALTGDSQLQLALPDSYRYIYKCIEGFTKWDAQYFLEISLDGYVSEQHLAFLPLYPLVISSVRQSLFGHTRMSFDQFLPPYSGSVQQSPPISSQDAISIGALENYIQAALVGVTFNNFILFPIAAIILFGLTKLVKREDDKYAKDVVWWFCYNPASIFFSSCYSESLFAALAFTTMFIIEYRSQRYLRDRHQSATVPRTKRPVGFEPLQHLNRLIYIILPALIPMALAGAARSNGLVNIGFIIFQFLIKYAPMLFTDRRLWSFLAYVSITLELFQDVLVLVMSSVLAASGYISYQIYSFLQFCATDRPHTKGQPVQPKPFWCNNLIPHAYGHVQARYWNVGLFRYYEIKQMPNFLLAAPITYIIMFGSLRSSKELTRTTPSLYKQQLVYYIQAITLTLLCSVSINIQVITRLLASSCPVIYWICADTVKLGDGKKQRMLELYFLAYFVVGIILHSNFYPWT